MVAYCCGNEVRHEYLDADVLSFGSCLIIWLGLASGLRLLSVLQSRNVPARTFICTNKSTDGQQTWHLEPCSLLPFMLSVSGTIWESTWKKSCKVMFLYKCMNTFYSRKLFCSNESIWICFPFFCLFLSFVHFGSELIEWLFSIKQLCIYWRPKHFESLN